MHADHAVRADWAQAPSYARADVAPMGPVPLVPEATHQLSKGPGAATRCPSRFSQRYREAEAGDRRHDQVEGIGPTPAVGARVGERADQVRELDERARPAMDEDERQGVRLGRTD